MTLSINSITVTRTLTACNKEAIIIKETVGYKTEVTYIIQVICCTSYCLLANSTEQ